MTSRYLIGIDLGTTNSAVAFVDTAAADPRVRVFEVPQLVAPGETAPRAMLPSFVYLPGPHELPAGAARLPWRDDADRIVGEFARTPRYQGAGSSQVNPTRVDIALDELRARLDGFDVSFAAGDIAKGGLPGADTDAAYVASLPASATCG